MRDYKFPDVAKEVILPNGVALTYCEYGEEHDEVIVAGIFYFHTFAPVLKELAKKYHVYGVEMRVGEGKGTQFTKDGDIHWANQWGEDIYEFTKAMGLKKFHYWGKCHGSIPGWWLVIHHPEVLESFCAFFHAPHVLPADDNSWGRVLVEEGNEAHLKRLIRKKENLPLKVQEQASLRMPIEIINKAAGYWASDPGILWDSDVDEIVKTMENIDIPVCMLYGTEDPLFVDWLSSDVKLMRMIKGVRTVVLQGEYHLMEMDCPDRIVSETMFFLDECKKGYC